MLLLLGLLRLLQAGCYCHSQQQQQDSGIEWITVTNDIAECHVNVPIDHFDKGQAIQLLVRRIKKGNPNRHLWILPEVLGGGMEETQIFLNNFDASLPLDTWCYMIESRTSLEGLPPEAYSLHNSAKDIIEASHILNITDNVYLLGDGFGSTLAYATLRQAPDFFTGALLINFLPSLDVHDGFEFDISNRLKMICKRDQECQSLLYETDAWSLLGSTSTADMGYCARSVETVVNHILPSITTDPRSFLRKATLLLARAFPNNPQNILTMYVHVSMCPNIKQLSRFYNSNVPKLFTSGINEQLEWLNKQTKYSLKATRAAQILLKSEQAESAQLCHEHSNVYANNLISECDRIISFPNDIPTYERMVLEPLKTKKTQILIISGSMNFDALPDRAREEFNMIESPSKYHHILNNHGYSLLHTVPTHLKDGILSSLFISDVKSHVALTESVEKENVKPLSWIVKTTSLEDPLHLTNYPDAANWFLWMTCTAVFATLPLLHFIYIYIIYY